MGEYAKLKGTGESVKIGTCEDMYYLRADQAGQVWAQTGNVDPIRDRELLRFRFPWPNEDHLAPGQFDDYDRGVTVCGMEAPNELDGQHHSVQFASSNPKGYLVSLPCPESSAGRAGPMIHRNGFAGATQLVQQRYHEGRLVIVLRCACGMRWRVPTIEDALPVAEYFQKEAERELDRGNTPRSQFYAEVAGRILAGYSMVELPVP